MKTIHVAWDNCFAQRNQTGTGAYARQLLKHLSPRQDLRLDVFQGYPAGARPNARIHRALQAMGRMAWTHIALPVRLWKFDVLHSPAFVAPLACPCPSVITVHDVTHLFYPSHFAGQWVWYMKSVVPATIKSANAIICGSEHSKRDIVTAYGLPPERVRVIPYGVDHQRFTPAALLDRNWAQSLGLRENYILHVGELTHRKNIPTLLRAVDRLRSQGKWGTKQLVLAGPDNPAMPGAAEIRETIRELDLKNDVLLAGRVPDEHLSGLYTHAKLLVMPSFYEGFGFPVVESMAAGTPVVASNTSSLPEVAGNAAVLVPPSDVEAMASAISDVMEKPALASELRARGLLQAQTFNWERTAAETMAVYRDVAQ